MNGLMTNPKVLGNKQNVEWLFSPCYSKLTVRCEKPTISMIILQRESLAAGFSTSKKSKESGRIIPRIVLHNAHNIQVTPWPAACGPQAWSALSYLILSSSSSSSSSSSGSFVRYINVAWRRSASVHERHYSTHPTPPQRQKKTKKNKQIAFTHRPRATAPATFIMSNYPIHIYIYWLAVSTPLKNILASWDYEIPNIWKNRGFSNHQPNILPSGIAIENDHL